VPRIPKTRDVMQSYRKPLAKLSLGDLGIDPAAANQYYQVAELFIPKKESHCEMIEGESLDEKLDELARRIKEVTSSM